MGGVLKQLCKQIILVWCPLKIYYFLSVCMCVHRSIFVYFLMVIFWGTLKREDMFQTSSICTRVKSYLDLDLNQEYDGEITEYISTVKIFCTNIFHIWRIGKYLYKKSLTRWRAIIILSLEQKIFFSHNKKKILKKPPVEL